MCKTRESNITGDYLIVGNIQDLGGNEIDPAELNISTSNNVLPTSLSAPAPTAFVDHLAPRPLSTVVRRLSGGSPSESTVYGLGETFIFTISFHEDLELINANSVLSNLRLDLDFDDDSSDRSIGLDDIPSSDPSKLLFTYVVSNGDQAASTVEDCSTTPCTEYNQTLALHGFSKTTGFTTLALVDNYGNQIDPVTEIDLTYYDLDGNGTVEDIGSDGIVNSGAGDENFLVLQPDRDLLIDGIKPYWVSISSSSSYTDSSGNDKNRTRSYALSEGGQVTFTLAASEDLSAELGMSLLLTLNPENTGSIQSRVASGSFYTPTGDAADTNYSLLTFIYQVGQVGEDKEADGIDHLVIMAESHYQSGSGYTTKDRAHNEITEKEFSVLVADGTLRVEPEDEYQINNQLKFDTTPPIIESVVINGFDSSNLAIAGTDISFTVYFEDDDLNLTFIEREKDEINLTVLNLSTGDNNNTEINSSFALEDANSDNLVFAGVFADNINWSGTLALQIFAAETYIVDKALAANGMQSESIAGSGSDDLQFTYTIDTAKPRVANLNEIDSTIDTPITATASGYGPDRQVTFKVTFNEELSSISGSAGALASMRFFIYDDLNTGTSSRGLKGRDAKMTSTSAGSPTLETIAGIDGLQRSVAYFYYTVSSSTDTGNTDQYDSGPVYLNYADTNIDPTSITGDYDYYSCFTTTVANETNCYIALDARIADVNSNTSTFKIDDSSSWIYAFNRENLSPRAPEEITRFVTDPLEIIGYRIRIAPTTGDRAWGYDVNSTDYTGSGTETIIAQNAAQPYIGASETEDIDGNPGNIYFVIEPGAEDFDLDKSTANIDVNLTFSVVGSSGIPDSYTATYYNANSEYITFAFNIGDFNQSYESNITLHSVSQDANMTYTNSSGVDIFADTNFYPSPYLDTWDPLGATYTGGTTTTPVTTSTAYDQAFDTGLLLDLNQPSLVSVTAYRDYDPTDDDENSSDFNVSVSAADPDSFYFGRDDKVVFRFEFSEAIGSVGAIGSNSGIIMPLELDTGTVEVSQATPTINDDRSITSDDVYELDITYTVLEAQAGSVNNDYFVLTAFVSDQNGNTISTEDLNLSLVPLNLARPRVNGDYPQLAEANIYRSYSSSNSAAEVSSPVPDVSNGIDSYTFTSDNINSASASTIYLAATFTYGVFTSEDPDFQLTANGGLPAGEYTFDLGDYVTGSNPLSSEVTTGLIDIFSTSTSPDSSSTAYENVLLFSLTIEEENLSSSGNNISLLDLVTDAEDIYGNPITPALATNIATVASIDSIAPEVIGLTLEPLSPQGTPVTYGPLDSNITFALTFSEPLDSSKTLGLNNDNLSFTFHINESASSNFLEASPVLSPANTVTSSIIMVDLTDSINLETGQVLHLVYKLSETTVTKGYIDVNLSARNILLTGTAYDSANGSHGNSRTISFVVDDNGTASDSNASAFIPIIYIEREDIEPTRLALESSISNLASTVLWESDVDDPDPADDPRVGIGYTLSFIIDYPAQISASSLYDINDTVGVNPESLNSTTLSFSASNTQDTYTANYATLFDNSTSTSTSTRLIYTYTVASDLDLDVEDIEFEQIELPADKIIRSVSFNEVIASGSDFKALSSYTRNQPTDVIIDGTYPQIESINVSNTSQYTYIDSSSVPAITYFGENDIITFNITFSEALEDTDISDGDPDFDLAWYIDDSVTGNLKSFDTSIETTTATAYGSASLLTGQVTYTLTFPIDLLGQSGALAGYQGPIHISADPSAYTTINANSGVLKDLAGNENARMQYQASADENLSYAVDFVRPRLEYVDSNISQASGLSRQYIEYTNVGGVPVAVHYGKTEIDFYLVHDSRLEIDNNANTGDPISLSASHPDNASIALDLVGSQSVLWPRSSSLTSNALQFELDLSASAINYAGSALTFQTVANATSYGDQAGNVAYFNTTNQSNTEQNYNTATGDLNLDNYVPGFDNLYPANTIYLDTTAPSFTISSTETIDIANRALKFNLKLDSALSILETSGEFNLDANSSYHTAPTYELTFPTPDASSGTILTFTGSLYDFYASDSENFAFTLFSGDAEYSTYLDNLTEGVLHTFTLALTDFVGNEYISSTDIVVEKDIDELLGMITGWDGSALYDTNSSNYSSNPGDDGNVSLANNATSATFVVSFNAEINEGSFTADDLTISTSDGDIAHLELDLSDGSNAYAGPSNIPNAYYVAVRGGNLPLAYGSFTLAFANSQDIVADSGGAVLNLNAMPDDHKSFSYSKDFNLTIATIAQSNAGSSTAYPELELGFTPIGTSDLSTASGYQQTIESYRIYYTASTNNPDVSSAYFDSAESYSNVTFVPTNGEFTHGCLPLLNSSSGTYSFRLAAVYSIATDDNASARYITDVAQTSSSVSLELNSTSPQYNGVTAPTPISCTAYQLFGSAADVSADLGRGLALSRNSLDHFLISGQTVSGASGSTAIDGGAVRYYPRSIADYQREDFADTILQFNDTQALDFGHQIAVPEATNSNYDLFVASSPLYDDGSGGHPDGYVRLFSKSTSDHDWQLNDLTQVANSSAGSALAMAEVNGNYFALIGYPTADVSNNASQLGKVDVYQFSNGAWSTSPADSAYIANLTSSIANDDLFGSAIAIAEDDTLVAIMSAKAVYLFNLSGTGSLTLQNVIAASDWLGSGASFAIDSVTPGTALALQKTDFANSPYLLAIGLPADSTEVVAGADAIDYSSISYTTAANAYRGSVLLLTPATITSNIVSTTEWRQLAQLRSDSQSEDAFYGSNLRFINPSAPALFVNEPAIDRLDTLTGSSAQLHLYYLNSNGLGANAQEDLLIKANTASFVKSSPAYAYAYDYTDNTLMLSHYRDISGGSSTIHNIITDLNYTDSNLPKIISTVPADDSTNSPQLTFIVRFPAVVDASSIDTSDFAVSFTTTGGFTASDFSYPAGAITGSLDYWQVVVDVSQSAQTSGFNGSVALQFASNASIQSAAGVDFDIAEFNTNAAGAGRIESYTLDYGSPALVSIARVDPVNEQMNQDSVTFGLSFSEELNTSNISNATTLDDTLDDIFSLTALKGSQQISYGVTELGDAGVEVTRPNGANDNTTFRVAFTGIETTIFTNDYSSFDDFSVELAIDTTLAVALLGDGANAIDSSSLVNPTGGSNDDNRSYIADFKAPEVTAITSSLAHGTEISVNNQPSIIYAITFSEPVAAEVNGSDFSYAITKSTATNSYTPDIDDTSLATLFSPNPMTNGSFYSLDTPGPAEVFTLTLSFNSADFNGLVTEPFHLMVNFQSVEDLAGNANPGYAHEDANYTINFNDFTINDQGFTIASNTSGSIADNNYTSTVNIIPFLQQRTIDASTNPSFGFTFSFSTPVDDTSVDIDDFTILYAGSSSANPTISYREYDSSTGNFGTRTETYNLRDESNSEIIVNSNVITLQYNLDDDMLKAGFDFAEALSVQLDHTQPNFDIRNASTVALTVSSAKLTYLIKSSMPLLERFERLDASQVPGSNGLTSDGVIGYYHTFDFENSSAYSDTYYGLQMHYRFSEDVASAVGADGTETYASPVNAFYLEGKNSETGSLSSSIADLLAYSSYPATSDLPETSTTGSGSNRNGYTPFLIDGSLVQSGSSDTSDASSESWYHLAYLTTDSSDFDNETSEHNFSIRYDDRYIAADISGNLPEIFGYVDSISSANFSGTYFSDADGNPARIDTTWFNSSSSPGAQALAYDTEAPVLLSATAVDVASLDNDNPNYQDDYAGTYSADGDIATFTFELVFSEPLGSTDQLSDALVWNLSASHNSTGNAASINPTSSVSDPVTNTSGDDRNYTYTVTNSVEGLFDTSGSYSISLDSTKPVTDLSGTSIDFSAANSTLGGGNQDLCYFGTCTFTNTPITISGFTVDPGSILAVTGDTSNDDEFNLTLTFSAPVLFAPSSGTADQLASTQAAFDIDYVVVGTNATIDAKSSATDYSLVIDAAIQPTGTVTTVDGTNYYHEYIVPFEDTLGLWARDDYKTATNDSDSEVLVYFATVETATRATDAQVNGSVLHINYLQDFISSTGIYPTITDTDDPISASSTDIFMVDPEDSSNRFTNIKLSLITTTPEVQSAYPVAADADNTQNSVTDSPVARHVAFDFGNTMTASYGDMIGAHLLYRTEDANFDFNSPPYYGADGGLFIPASTLDENNIGYHICPPFSKRLDGPNAGIQSVNAYLSYNPNRMKIHYLVIPYDVTSDSPFNGVEINSSLVVSADFSTSADHLSSTEPCVRSAFYNKGQGQYGYVVDSNRDEDLMVIANAVLQDQNGYDIDLAALPVNQHANVYFDLYSKDFYNDSWQLDHTQSLSQLLSDLETGLSGSHDTASGVSVSFDSSHDQATIFASRFVNTINARFLDNVFYDNYTVGSIKKAQMSVEDFFNSEVVAAFDAHIAADINTTFMQAPDPANDSYDDYQGPLNFVTAFDSSTATIALINHDRLVLSVGVHPESIEVDAGTGPFTPFATKSEHFLEMDAEFYDLHYSGDSATVTKPAFDYTARHLAYVNFDLVYDVNRDSNGAITRLSLVSIVSPFTLLQNELFSSSTLQRMKSNGEVYSAVAASIADNVFRHNFPDNTSSSKIGHYLPVGVYCRLDIVSASNTDCANDFAQMLLPTPNNSNYQRTSSTVSDHYLHRHLLRLNPNDYSVLETTQNDYDLLSDILHFTDANSNGDGPYDNMIGVGKTIDQHSYSAIIYNSFDRDYILNYNNEDKNYEYSRNLDNSYITDSSGSTDPGRNFEQSFFGLSPFAESPNARADQILPNAFFLGNQINDYHFRPIAKPYQHTGYTVDIKDRLKGQQDDLSLISSNIYGLTDARTAGSTAPNRETSIRIMHQIWNYPLPTNYQVTTTASYLNDKTSYVVGTAAGPRTDLNRMYFFGGDHMALSPMAHIYASAPHHFRQYERLSNTEDAYSGGTGTYYGYYYSTGPNLFSGRLPGMSTGTYGSERPDYIQNHSEWQYDFTDVMAPATSSSVTTQLGYFSSSAYSTIPSSFTYIALGDDAESSIPAAVLATYRYNNSNIDTIETDALYDQGRTLTPADDYDFNRGQTLARKLGFFIDEGTVFEGKNDIDDDTNSIQQFGSYLNIFLPTSPDTDVGLIDSIVSNYNTSKVSNYYPLVAASESLYTAAASYPSIALAYKIGSFGSNYHGMYTLPTSTAANTGYYVASSAPAALLLGEIEDSSNDITADAEASSNSGSLYHHIPLDKIFPAGYHYQLGFINREELFMYDPASGGNGGNGGDTAATPQINRFSEAGVGSFGYASQYSRLNRRSMIRYHQSTSSQFLGDHLARFQSTPTPGVHSPTSLDAVYAHTPANQGATGTNYGSYAAGHYNMTTAESQTAGTWKHRTYTGSLRGYVIELRTNPLYTTPMYEMNTDFGAAPGYTFQPGIDYTDNTSDRP